MKRIFGKIGIVFLMALIFGVLSCGRAYAVATTWNPNDKCANAVLSNNNLTITITSLGSARATTGKSSGKWYWEVTMGKASSSMVGVGTSAASMSNYLGTDSYGWGYYAETGCKYNNSIGHGPTYGASYTTGDTIGVALDCDGGKITFYKNGVSQGIAYSTLPTGTTIYPIIATAGTGYVETSTVNFGATPFKYEVPNGYAPFDSTPVLIQATGMTLNKTSATLTAGQPDQLVATITPDNATNKTVKWTSSDEAIVKVDATGKVTTFKEGKATITATTTDGSNLSAKCEVTVVSAAPTGAITLTAATNNSGTPAITLNWNTLDGATSYNVKKSTTQGGTYTTIKNVTTASCTDSDVQAGTTYYYVVTPVNSTGEGKPSNEVSAVLAAAPTNKLVLNIEPAKNKIKKNETVTASLTIDNITNIAAEDVKITYDAEKLQFVGAAEVDGIKLVKNDAKAGELRFILASKGAANVVNAKKILLNLNFRGIKAGDALVDVVKGKVSDGITSEDNLSDAQCGQATITIEDMKDVNNSGEFTLLDLAIDGRHLGEAPATLPQYNTDIVVNSAIDDADLLEIGNQMLANPNYTL